MMSKMLCIVAALKEEAVGIKGLMTIDDSPPLSPGRAFTGSCRGRAVLLLLSGMGKQRAGEALTLACERFPLSAVVSIGYAGGLCPTLQEADLVFADKVFESAAAPENQQSLQTSETLLERAVTLCPDIPSHRGGLLTVDEAVCKPEEKRDLGNRYPVLAVDMETAGLLTVALKHGLPFLSVRAITDTVDQELVDFSSCVEESGEISRLKAGWHILTHPGTLPRVRELRGHCRKATQHLTRFVSEFLPFA
ncbi:MAG: hypothetical protein ACE5G9_02130 [Nitrospinales bacterium]